MLLLPHSSFRLIKEFDREIKDEENKNPPEVNKQLNDEKQSMVSWNLLLRKWVYWGSHLSLMW